MQGQARNDVNAAFAKLQQYALALENPPLLVVCGQSGLRCPAVRKWG
jgi:hypothetical protein